MADVKNILVDVYNAAGEKVSQQELPADIFAIEVKKGLLHLAVVAQMANARVVLAKVKTRAEVRGGGKKPWKQKGTGRARHGSIRSPLWRGGGVAWGPNPNRNFSQKLNRKVKQKALKMALSQKAQEGRIVLLDAEGFDGKTKSAALTFSKLPLGITKTKTPRVTFVSPAGAVETNRSLRNLGYVTVVPAHSMNVVDLLNCKTMVIPLASVEQIRARFSKKETE